MVIIRTCWNILCISCLVLCGYIAFEWRCFLEEAAKKEEDIDDDASDG